MIVTIIARSLWSRISKETDCRRECECDWNELYDIEWLKPSSLPVWNSKCPSWEEENCEIKQPKKKRWLQPLGFGISMLTLWASLSWDNSWIWKDYSRLPICFSGNMGTTDAISCNLETPVQMGLFQNSDLEFYRSCSNNLFLFQRSGYQT